MNPISFMLYYSICAPQTDVVEFTFAAPIISNGLPWLVRSYFLVSFHFKSPLSTYFYFLDSLKLKLSWLTGDLWFPSPLRDLPLVKRQGDSIMNRNFSIYPISCKQALCTRPSLPGLLITVANKHIAQWKRL